MKKKNVNEAASLLGMRSAEARKKKLGSQEFVKRMRELGRLGGRPKKNRKKEENDFEEA